MARIKEKLTMLLLSFLAVLMIFCAVTTVTTAAEQEEGNKSTQVLTSELVTIEYNSDKMSVFVNPTLAKLKKIDRAELVKIYDNLMTAMENIFISDIFSSVKDQASSAALTASAEEIPPLGELPDFAAFDIKDFEDYIKERLKQDGELNRYLDGEYDTLLKFAVSEYLKGEDIEGEDIQQQKDKIAEKVEGLVQEVIDEVYAEDEVKKEELTSKNETKKEEVKDLVQEVHDNGGQPDITFGEIIGVIDEVRLDDIVIMENGSFMLSGVRKLLATIPSFGEIAQLKDDEMKLDYQVECITGYGDVSFELTIGFKGNCDRIRRVARRLANTIDFSSENGVYNVKINAPESLSDLFLKLTQTNHVSDNVKQNIFALFDKDVDSMWNERFSYTEFIEFLKSADFEKLFANIFNAEAIQNFFDGVVDLSRLTDDTIDRVLNGILNRFKGKDFANMSDDEIRTWLNKFFDASKFTHDQFQKFRDLLSKLDFDRYDAEYVRDFFAPGSGHSNQTIYDFIDDLGDFESVYNALMRRLEHAYDLLPENLKNVSVMSLYSDGGNISWQGNINVDLEKILGKMATVVDRMGYGKLSTVLDNVIIYFDDSQFDVNVSIDMTMTDINRITYYADEEKIISGLLPTGATIDTFAGVTQINDYDILKWVDKDGNEITSMPAEDIDVYAVTEYDLKVTLDDGEEETFEFSGKFNNVAHVFKVTPNSGAGNTSYTYKWFKNNEPIDNDADTLSVKDVIDSGVYKCEVTSDKGITVWTEEITVEIFKEKIEFEFKWDYTEPFVYNGEIQTVSLIDYDEEVFDVKYEQNSATDAGSYIAKATVSVNEAHAADCEIAGETSDTLEWEIKKLILDFSDIIWDYSEPIIYDGEKHTVAIDESSIDPSIIDKINIAYDGDTEATNAGSYTVSYTITLKDAANYILKYNGEVVGDEGITDTLEWKIEKQMLDLSAAAWDYDEPIIYDGEEHTVAIDKSVLTSVIDKIDIAYDGEFTARTAGEYTATAVISVKTDFAQNYAIEGADIDGTLTLPLEWKIEKQEVIIDADLVWLSDGEEFEAPLAIIYDEKAHTVAIDESVLASIADKISIVYAGDKTATNSGSYTASVTITLKDIANYVLKYKGEVVGDDGITDTLEWEIKKQTVKVEDKWVYDENKPIEKGPLTLIYDGVAHTLTLAAIDSKLDVAYTENSATNAGSYTATAVISVKTDFAQNYAIEGAATDGKITFTLAWTIEKQTVKVEDKWVYDETKAIEEAPLTLTYDGVAHTLTLAAIDSKLDVAYTENSATNAGSYTATAVISVKTDFAQNYAIEGAAVDGKITLTLAWTIEKQEVSIDADLVWLSDGEPFQAPLAITYDGKEHTVAINESVLASIIDKIDIAYDGDKMATDAKANGYTASVKITLKDAANYALKYKGEVLGDEGITDSLTWTINPIAVDVSQFEWNYSSPFTYNGNQREVRLVDVPEYITVTYSENKGTRAGNYTAEATLTASTNYELSAATLTLEWTINKYEIDLAGAQWGNTTFVYDANEHTITIINLDEIFVDVPDGGVEDLDYTGNSATDAGNYKAEVALKEQWQINYVIIGFVPREWKIEPAEVDIEDFEWDYTQPFTYDGNEKKVELKNVPSYVQVTYSGNTATQAGEYTATATLAIKGTNYQFSSDNTTLTLKWEIVGGSIVVPPTDYTSGDVTVTDHDGKAAGCDLFAQEVDDIGDVDLSDIAGKGKKATVGKAYEVHFEKDGEQQSLNGKFTVRLLIPEHLRDKELGKQIKVIHIHDGVVTEITDAVREGDYAVFTVDNFSIFAIVEIKNDAKSMWWLWLLLVLLILLPVLLLLIILLIFRRRKKDEPQEEKPEPKKEEPVAPAPVKEEPVAPAPVKEEPVAPAPVAFVPADKEPVVVLVPVIETMASTQTPEPQPAPVAPAVSPVIVPPPVETRLVYRRGFIAKLSQSEELIRKEYSELKNNFLSYKGVRSRVSWGYESFNKGRNKCVRFRIKGKSIAMYIALDPKTLNVDKYHHKDLSDKAKFAEMPTMIKIRSKRSVKYAKELFAMLMAKYEAKKLPEAGVNYVLPHMTDEKLIKDGYIKVKEVVVSDFNANLPSHNK